jgi:hypothetical protein
MLLVQEKFDDGWKEYEWRLRLPHYFNSPTRFTQPMWDGSNLEGKTIFVHAEQGLGDTIHFVRFLPLLKEKQAGRIILECQPELVRLMKQTEILSGMEIIPRDKLVRPTTGFDVHVPLLSLPLLLRRLAPTDHNGVPQPPYMKPDTTLQQLWLTRLPKSNKLKVGIAWAGSAVNKNDRHRSIPLSSFAPLAAPDIEFYALQFGPPAKEAASPPPGMNLIDITPNITDFADTAALLPQLDLIICVDTALAHLTGAMARPVWVLLQFTPDFRWLLQGEKTAWYPSMRLFRQQKFGDWAEVIERVAAELKKNVGPF